MSNRPHLILTLGCALAAAPAFAAPLATYDFGVGAANNKDFNTTATNGGGAPPFNPATPAGLSATSLTATGGGTTNGVRLGTNEGVLYPIAHGQVLFVGTASNAFSDSDYFSFTLTPDAGNALDLESITLQAARGGGSTRGFRVKSSVDGFVASLNDVATETIASQRPTFTPYTIDLSAASFDALAAPVEFRVYVYSSAVNNTVEMDNLIVNGEVGLVPEPGSFGLLGLGGLALLRRRKASAR